MTPTNAIAYLKRRHGNVDVINPSLFAVTENGSRVLYQLKNDVLQRRVDVDVHTCRWDPIV